MHAPLDKFPFKHMLEMVGVIAEAPGGASLGDIAAGGHSCYPDTREVTSMASYLTSFGRVQGDGKGWTRAKIDLEPGRQVTFRKRFVEEVERVINALSQDPKDIYLISSETGIDEQAVREYLSFLAELTGRGHVVSRKKRGGFKLVPW